MSRFKLNIFQGLLILILMLTGKMSFAQQDPMFTQYNFNIQTINPAYAGTWESLGFLALGRYQWVGMAGAPTTYTFSVQSPLRNEKVGLGFNIISDQIGREKRLSLFGDYSYRLTVGEDTHLRLGIKFGIINYSNNLSSYLQNDEDGRDPMSEGGVDVRYMPNLGVGGFLYSKDYYVGISVPRILNNEIKNNVANISANAAALHYFLMAGYVFNLSENIKLKPTFLTKATLGAPVEFDFTASVLLREQFWLGAMYRTGDSFGFIAQWVYNKKLRIGYGIDFTTTRLQNFNKGSHEIMVSYEIGIKRKWSTPRTF